MKLNLYIKLILHTLDCQLRNMATESSNSLISATKLSNSGLYASLHPLVLLTISDYITRHTLRHQTTPIVGALLGQQKGREVTVEHAYDVKLLPLSDGQAEWKLHESFFADRLQQYKDVHKEPALELVGWWTISGASGPGPEVLGIHNHVLHTFNETALLLAFHPEKVGKQAESQQNGQMGSQMPLTIYESVYEAASGDADGDAIMADNGEVKEGAKLDIKLKELPYDIVTGEAEMISVDFVAKGSGNANLGAKLGERGNADNTKDKAKSTIESSEHGKNQKVFSTTFNPEEEERKLLVHHANSIDTNNVSHVLPYLARQRYKDAAVSHLAAQILSHTAPFKLPHR